MEKFTVFQIPWSLELLILQYLQNKCMSLLLCSLDHVPLLALDKFALTINHLHCMLIPKSVSFRNSGVGPDSLCNLSWFKAESEMKEVVVRPQCKVRILQDQSFIVDGQFCCPMVHIRKWREIYISPPIWLGCSWHWTMKKRDMLWKYKKHFAIGLRYTAFNIHFLFRAWKSAHDMTNLMLISDNITRTIHGFNFV